MRGVAMTRINRNRLKVALSTFWARIALVSLLAVNAHAAPALYLNTNGSGWPLVRADGTVDSLCCQRVARYPTITLNVSPFESRRPDVVRYLRLCNPRLRIMGYALVGASFPYFTPGSFWTEQWAQVADHLVRYPDGKPYPDALAPWPDWSDSALVRPASALWCDRAVGSHLFDSVFLDYVGTHLWRSVPEDSARAANLGRLVAAIRSAGGPCFTVAGNGDAAGLQGTMFEGWPWLTYGTFRASFAALRAAPAGSWVKVETYAPVGSSEWNRAWRFALGCAALVNGHGYAGPNRYVGPEGPGWPDEASVTPLVPGVSDGRTDTTGRYVSWLGELRSRGEVQPDVWVGKFDHGLVVVNGSDTAVTVDLGAPLWREPFGRLAPTINAGRTVQRVSVGVQDARFYLARGKR